MLLIEPEYVKQSRCDPRSLARSVTNTSQLESTARGPQFRSWILASSKEAGSQAKMHETGKDFADKRRRLVAEFKRSYRHDDFRFVVPDTDEFR